MKLIKHIKKSTTFYPQVFIPSIIIILVVSTYCSFYPAHAADILDCIKNYIFANLSWFYIFAVALFVILLLLTAFSSIGNIKLGSNDSEPEYPILSWISMLFAAGMGIGLMYFGVAEPMSHYVNPLNPGSSDENAKNAILYTFFHWGIHAWAIYGIVGLVLAYFCFRYKLPLALRSGLYPLIKDKINGPIGHAVDIFALVTTIFGIATTLGFGVVQVATGLKILGVIQNSQFSMYVLLVVVLISCSVISSITGVGRGVRRLSEANIILAVLLMVFVLITGPTVHIMQSFIENIGYYLTKLPLLTFKTYAYEPGKESWFNGWTVLYWAWWISWAPFVGIFIARISKGRTIREFVFGVLLIPSMFNFLWMAIYGSSAINFDRKLNTLTPLISSTDLMLFKFFEHLPASTILSFVALIVICIFFVTSADSGIFVINSIATNNAKRSPKWQNIFWGVVLVVLPLVLLRSGGLPALQSMNLITAFPFCVVMFFLSAGFIKGVYIDKRYYGTKFTHITAFWDNENWKKRLDKIMTYPQKKEMRSFINTIIIPAMNELADEMRGKNLDVEVRQYSNPLRMEFHVEMGQLKNFTYGVTIHQKSISETLVNELEQIVSDEIYIPVTYFYDGRIGYDIQYMDKIEIIADILKQYERFLFLAGNEDVSLITHETSYD